MYKRLLVAVDGSEQSYKALDHAVNIAKKFGSELTLLAVVPTTIVPCFLNERFGMIPKDLVLHQDKMMAIYKNILMDAGAKVRFEHPNLNVSTILREGRPSTNIVDVAENDGYDLIIMGSRGIGGITGWILGSNSYMVVDSCTKPVIIIK